MARLQPLVHATSARRTSARRWVSGVLTFLLLYALLWMAFSGAVLSGDGWAGFGLPGSVARAAAENAEGDVPAEMQARAEAVFARVADALAPEHDIHGQYTIQVVREKVPNAWINQNNEIYVSTGLMELLTDDQLAGVIGHEIAHGTLGHIPHRINQSLWSAFAVLALGVVASSSGQADWGGLLHMRDLFMFAYSRDQEAQADLVGMGYARAAGYEAEGLVEALQLMDQERGKLPSDSPWQDVYRTHPPIPQRVSDLRFVLTSERVLRPPLPAGGLTSRSAAATAEEAAIAFARALLSGDLDVAERLLLPGADGASVRGHAGGLGDQLERIAPVVGTAWTDASGEIVSRSGDESGPILSFDETLIVRLVRPALEAHGAEGVAIVSPALSITVRRSAAGWFVVVWDLVGD